VTLGADLLMQTEELGTRGERIIAQITTSVQSAIQMVNDLLDLARCNLGNGIPVRPEPTDLTSVCKAVVNELSAAPPEAEIRFTDSGPVTGQYDPSRMAQALPSLFNPERRYSNISEGEKDTSSGLGLGLFIASQIVEGHGGTIEVESTLAQGTIFRVILPNREHPFLPLPWPDPTGHYDW
jgi:signal transduction histidine kinase